MTNLKALQINLVNYHIDVSITDKYYCIQKIMSKYSGLLKSTKNLLKELDHPYKNWQYINNKIKIYSLEYFYFFKENHIGHISATAVIEIFIKTIESDSNEHVRTNAADNLVRYLNFISIESKKNLIEFIPSINKALNWMKSCKFKYFQCIMSGYFSIKKLIKNFVVNGKQYFINYTLFNKVTIRYLHLSYSYWLEVKSPTEWVKKNIKHIEKKYVIKNVFSKVSHKNISKYNFKLTKIKNENIIKKYKSKKILNIMINFPDNHSIISKYKRIPLTLNLKNYDSYTNKFKILYFFYTISIPGLSSIHKDLLIQMNKTIKHLIKNEKNDYIKNLLDKTFFTLKESTKFFPKITLSCIKTIGNGIYKTDRINLVETFIDKVIHLEFQNPGIYNVGDDWQIKINEAHITNIRVWMQLIRLKPKWSKKLISILIINLSIFGVFIKDTDLFPKEITSLLNSDIAPVYNISKQLARLFPVYFNDIGAEGKLREISTQLDEITFRQDVLIHFLRKQCHVESSNRIIAFIESIIKFWKSKNKKILKSFVPPLIYSQIKTEGIYIDGVKEILTFLKIKKIKFPNVFLSKNNKKTNRIIKNLKEKNSLDFKRLFLLAKFYKLIQDKYNLNYKALKHHIGRLRKEKFPYLEEITTALKSRKLQYRILLLLNFVKKLKLLILSKCTYKSKSEIYKKRHFAVDIPSTYGSYYELKFATIGLTFRLESFLNVLFEELNDNIPLDLITKNTFCEIHKRLKLFYKALKIDGIQSIEFERQLNFLYHSLEIREFTFTQYMDIFKGFLQAVKNITNDYFYNIHGENLTKILSKINLNVILKKYFLASKSSYENIKHRIFEIFFREKISMSLGLQQLDVFLGRIYNTISEQSIKLPKKDLQLLLNYNSGLTLTTLEKKKNKANGIIYLGSKGINIQKLHILGLPTPPCFIITTEAFRCRNLIKRYPPIRNNFKKQVIIHVRKLEKITGKKFGSTKNPMLLSVRSGSSVSQPGMMNTLVNVGINTKIVKKISQRKRNKWFAWDCYRRFLRCYSSSLGLKREEFDNIENYFKKLFNEKHKKDFSGKQMKSLTTAYKLYIRENKMQIPDNPYEQLFTAIDVVFSSWESKKAIAYRSIMDISDDWGTAVIIQDMIFGNISKNSGTGVFFTHNPRWLENALNLWGDFTTEGQGEDVVSGLVKTFPISMKQQNSEFRESTISLETHFPEIYLTIKKWANILVYKEDWGPQEVEFTFESSSSKNIYILQTRDMTIREPSCYIRLTNNKNNKKKYIGRGIGVSGGSMYGRIVFTYDNIKTWRKKEPNTFLILLRRETVPDDIREIFAADGLLTSKGGITSHASVIAHRLGKTCVVGCSNLIYNEKKKIGIFNNSVLKSGNFIIINGINGCVYF